MASWGNLVWVKSICCKFWFLAISTSKKEITTSAAVCFGRVTLLLRLEIIRFFFVCGCCYWEKTYPSFSCSYRKYFGSKVSPCFPTRQLPLKFKCWILLLRERRRSNLMWAVAGKLISWTLSSVKRKAFSAKAPTARRAFSGIPFKFPRQRVERFLVELTLSRSFVYSSGEIFMD